LFAKKKKNFDLLKPDYLLLVKGAPMKLTESHLKQIIESEFMSYLTKPMFAKKPPTGEEKEQAAKLKILALLDEITEMMENTPTDLEGMVITLREIKEKLSRALIWGDSPLLDLIKK